MNLHNDKELFEQLIILTSEYKKIDSVIIEKDYFVVLFLKEIIKANGNFIFKGGTSLSKCYKLIDRFSEDIDIGYNCSSLSRKVKKDIKEIIKFKTFELGFNITNINEIRSGRDFNRYEIDYKAAYSSFSVKPKIIVETAFQVSPFSIDEKEIESYIYDYLVSVNRFDIIENYNLEPYSVKVQNVLRTFIDKVYAICDYHISNQINSHSRHLYDLYKIEQTLDPSLIKEIQKLVPQVRKERQKSDVCLSVKDGIIINDLLVEIIKKDIYKSDYKLVTSNLLFDDVTYEKCIEAIEKIIKLNLFL